LRVTLSDEGEGWPQGAPAFSGSVIGEVPDLIEGRFLKVQFDKPVRVYGRGLVSGVWIKEHFRGQVVGSEPWVSVYTWLVAARSGWGEPPNCLPDLWARCEVTD